ncbi:MAG: hypothetical protein MJ188_09840 [Treponema sp.]|nr:hypothetical protein [Treponema sp.]
MIFLCPECGVNEVGSRGELCYYCFNKRDRQNRKEDYERERHNREFEQQMALQKEQAQNTAREEEEKRRQLLEEQNWILQKQANHDNTIHDIEGLTDYFIFFQTHEITMDNFDQVREAWNKANSYNSDNCLYDVKTLLLKMHEAMDKIKDAYKAMELQYKPIDEERKRQKELAEAKAQAELKAKQEEADRQSNIDSINYKYDRMVQPITFNDYYDKENAKSDADTGGILWDQKIIDKGNEYLNSKLYMQGNVTFCYDYKTNTAELSIDEIINEHKKAMTFSINVYAVPSDSDGNEKSGNKVNLLTIKHNIAGKTFSKIPVASLSNYEWNPPELYGYYIIQIKLQDDKYYYDYRNLGHAYFAPYSYLMQQKAEELKPYLKNTAEQSSESSTAYYPGCITFKDCQCQISTNSYHSKYHKKKTA